MLKAILAVILLVIPFTVNAVTSTDREFKVELLARALLNDTYNLPPMSYLYNTNPVINSRGDVSFKVISVSDDARQSVWLKHGNASGEIVYTSQSNIFISDPSINSLGQVTFSPTDEFRSEGIYVYSSADKELKLKLNGADHNFSYYSYPQTTRDGTGVFRGMTLQGERKFYRTLEGRKDLEVILAEGSEHFGMPVSYIFGSAMNDKNQLAVKVRLGPPGEYGNAQPDRILLLEEIEGQLVKTFEVKTTKEDPDSLFVDFSNTVGLSQDGSLAFVGYLKNGKKAIVTVVDKKINIVAVEGENEINSLELFTPRVNKNGVAAFRAINSKGYSGLYISYQVKGQRQIQRLLGAGDSVPSDKGLAYILLKEGYIGMAGQIDLNDLDQLVFSATLESMDRKDLGNGVFRIQLK